MGPSRRTVPAEGLRESNKREKLARIRQAARELFEVKGFKGATAREICRRAGVATGTLFLYARDKHDLLFLVFSDDARALLRAGMARARPDMPLADALMCVFGTFLGFYARNRELSELIAGELFYRSFYRARGSTQMAALTDEYLACIAELVERARDRGELRIDVPLAEQVSACFAHYAFAALTWLGEPAVELKKTKRALHRALSLQIEGLAPPPAAGPARRTDRSGRRSRRGGKR